MGENGMLNLKKTDDKKDRVTRLLQQKAKVESDLARARKAEKDAQRRDETRRKIVLGGALMRGIEEGKIPPAVGRAVIAFMAERDKPLFENFGFKTTELGTRPDDQRE